MSNSRTCCPTCSNLPLQVPRCKAAPHRCTSTHSHDAKMLCSTTRHVLLLFHGGMISGQERVFAGDKETPDAVATAAPSREFQLKLWHWDIFVCHAGEEKPFAQLLRNCLNGLGLRCFVDEDDLRVADNAQQAMDAALRTTHIAVVLLCEEFFQKEAPQEELRQILIGRRACRNELVPVFLGVSVEECKKLAQPAGLADVCAHSGVRHAYERHRFQGKPVHREETMQRIVCEICRMTGLQSPF